MDATLGDDDSQQQSPGLQPTIVHEWGSTPYRKGYVIEADPRKMVVDTGGQGGTIGGWAESGGFGAVCPPEQGCLVAAINGGPFLCEAEAINPNWGGGQCPTLGQPKPISPILARGQLPLSINCGIQGCVSNKVGDPSVAYFSHMAITAAGRALFSPADGDPNVPNAIITKNTVVSGPINLIFQGEVNYRGTAGIEYFTWLDHSSFDIPFFGMNADGTKIYIGFIPNGLKYAAEKLAAFEGIYYAAVTDSSSAANVWLAGTDKPDYLSERYVPIRIGIAK